MCTAQSRMQRRSWSEPSLDCFSHSAVKMKRQLSRGGPALLFPQGSAGVQAAAGGYRGWQVWRRDPHTASLYCALRDRYGRGRRAKAPGWVTDTCGLLGKCHTSGSHTVRGCCVKKERRQTEKGQRESGCPFMLFRSRGKEAEMWL